MREWKARLFSIDNSLPVGKNWDMIHRLLPFLSALKPTRLGVLFAVLIGFGVGFWEWGKPPQPRLVLEKVGKGITTYFSPDGGTLATTSAKSSGKCSLALWDFHSGQLKINLFQSEHYPRAAAFSPDGSTLACMFDEQIRIWEVSTGREVATYENKNWIRRYLVFSPQGKLRAVREDYSLCDVADNKIIARLATDGEQLIRGENAILRCKRDTDFVKVWKLATATLSVEREIPKIGEFNYLEITSDHRFLICYPAGGLPIFIFDLVSGQQREFSLRYAPTGLAFDPDSQILATSSFGPPQTSWWNWFKELFGIEDELSLVESVTLHAFSSGEQVLVLQDCSSPVFSPDGKILAVTSANRTSLQLWDLPIRKPIGKILGRAGLAAVATLLAINGLGWLRRRRRRLKANLVPNSVLATE
jgi:hypothetical protein